MVHFFPMFKVALAFFHLTFEVKSLSVTIQMKAIEQVFPIELHVHRLVQGGSNF